MTLCDLLLLVYSRRSGLTASVVRMKIKKKVTLLVLSVITMFISDTRTLSKTPSNFNISNFQLSEISACYFLFMKTLRYMGWVVTLILSHQIKNSSQLLPFGDILSDLAKAARMDL